MSVIITEHALSQIIGKRLFPQSADRCEYCGWPIKEKLKDGCTKTICRMVPRPPKHVWDFFGNESHSALLFDRMLDEGMQFSMCKLSDNTGILVAANKPLADQAVQLISARSSDSRLVIPIAAYPSRRFAIAYIAKEWLSIPGSISKDVPQGNSERIN